MLVAPSDYLLVEIKEKYDDEIKFKSGVKLFIDPSFNPNFHATTEGIVHSVPRSLSSGEECKIRPGDQVIFNYRVVGDQVFEDNTDCFRMTTLQEGYITEWMNQERETIRLCAARSKSQWAAMYLDKHMNLLQGKVGTQGECENWLAQNFRFAEGEGFEFENRLFYNGKELWRVDYNFCFGFRRNGRLTMCSDYLMCEVIVEDMPKLIIAGTELVQPDAHRYCVRENKAWLRAGEGKKLKNGDVLYFDPNMKEKYNIKGLPRIIVRRRYVLGVESPLEFGQPIGIN